MQAATQTVLDLRKIKTEMLQTKIDNVGYKTLLLNQVDLVHERLIAELN